MFGFFTDIKNRLVALEQKIEVIWNHLFHKVDTSAQVEAPAVTEAAPAAAAEVAPEANNDAVQDKEAS